jgi:hypothetical protein
VSRGSRVLGIVQDVGQGCWAGVGPGRKMLGVLQIMEEGCWGCCSSGEKDTWSGAGQERIVLGLRDMA